MDSGLAAVRRPGMTSLRIGELASPMRN